ncbi:MAG: alpha/beta hydrolase, partial [Candidatus Omnitrophica bacterium]|nr:alpha/beta hydrolase [Candidatus Omnitrophota bacterium]
MPKAKLNDISLYYKVYGNGAPFLLIGGLGSDSSSWLGVVKEFSSYFQTIIFDNRGCGRSSAGGKSTMTEMAKDAIALLDFLKIEKAHILGHSMGGYIAQELAINYPNRVNKLILESTAPVSSKRNNTLLKDIYSQLEKEGHSEAWFKRWIEWLFSPELIADNSFVEMFIKNSIEYPYRQKADGFKSQIEAIASFDVCDKISAIKAKTLILEGKNDILITPEEVKALAKNIHGSTVKLLDGVAHCIHIENPKLFT